MFARAGRLSSKVTSNSRSPPQEVATQSPLFSSSANSQRESQRQTCRSMERSCLLASRSRAQGTRLLQSQRSPEERLAKPSLRVRWSPFRSRQVESGTGQPPRVKFSQPGISATATAVIQDGAVVSVSVSEGGRYRSTPTITFEPAPDVESISVTDGGSGYTRPPSVLLVGGSGSGATATCSINGAVTHLTLDSKGVGYSSPPNVVFSGGGGSGAAAIAGLNEQTGEVSGLTILSGGSGYQYPPSVSFVGGGGSGASATTKIAGPVGDVTVKSRGVNYDRPPQVFFQGGGGTGAAATATTASPGGGAQATCRINGSVVCCKITSEGSGYESQPTVTFSDAGNFRIADLQYTLAHGEITQQDFDDLASQYRESTGPSRGRRNCVCRKRRREVRLQVRQHVRSLGWHAFQYIPRTGVEQRKGLLAGRRHDAV